MHKGRDGQQLSTTGICIERNDCHCVVYRGTRGALIAAGLAGPDHFPEGRRRFSWHFPKSGTNWGMRRRSGDVYCLTKLKDPNGVVDAEVTAFYRCARREARRDTGFQRFLEQVHSASMVSRPRAAVQNGLAVPDAHASREFAATRTTPTGGLETLAVATLLFGLTVFIWSRQA